MTNIYKLHLGKKTREKRRFLSTVETISIIRCEPASCFRGRSKSTCSRFFLFFFWNVQHFPVLSIFLLEGFWLSLLSITDGSVLASIQAKEQTQS